MTEPLLKASAGVIIERNLNFVAHTAAGNCVYYAGTRLFQMRSLPPYVGDSFDVPGNVPAITDINESDTDSGHHSIAAGSICGCCKPMSST